jgi:hypothetical protein
MVTRFERRATMPTSTKFTFEGLSIQTSENHYHYHDVEEGTCEWVDEENAPLQAPTCAPYHVMDDDAFPEPCGDKAVVAVTDERHEGTMLYCARHAIMDMGEMQADNGYETIVAVNGALKIAVQ